MEQNRCYGCMKLIKSGRVCEHCGYDQNKNNEIHQLKTGTILKEQYMIGKVLGQGGFGITYLAWDMYLDIPVAIKEYFPSGTVIREASVSMEVRGYSGDEGMRFQNNKERFMREAKMLARFSDVPEIVQVKNFFLANNTAYIVMEYVQGITLKEYVKKHGGSLPLETVMELMKPIVGALCKVHKEGLIHRDISPDNIMMLANGRAKLLDFGAVRDVGNAENLTKSTEAILKRGYAPIEQYQNRGNLGPWTDIYALCATIYYCLTGQVPPDAPERLLDQDTVNFSTLNLSLQREQEQTLTQGMALRVAERISSMDELYERLFLSSAVEKEEEIISQQETAEEKQQTLFSEEKKEEILESKRTLEEKEIKKQDKNQKGNRAPKYLFMGAAIVIVLTIAAVFSNQSDANPTFSGGDSEKNTVSEIPTETETVQILTGQCGENAYWELNLSTGRLVISGEGEMYNFNGSWQVGENGEYRYEDGYDDNRDFTPWVDYREDILSLEIGDGITVIGENAFENCNNLKEVQWGSGLEEIRFQSFLATGLEKVEFPEGLKRIKDCAFNWCLYLEEVILPSSLEAVDAWAFNCCRELKKVQFMGVDMQILTNEEGYTPFTDEETNEHSPNLIIYGYTGSTAELFAQGYGIAFCSLGVQEGAVLEGQCGDEVTWRLDLESRTLYLDGEGQTWLYQITDEDRVNWANEIWPHEWLHYDRPGWYMYRHSIEHIVVGDGITSLNHNLFQEMYSLKTIDFGKTGEMHCTLANSGIEEIILPETMYGVGEWCIAWNENLKKVTIDGGSRYVDMGVFSGCIALEEVYFSKNAFIRGDLFNPNGDDSYSENVIFYVYKDSDAERYAKEYQIPYKIRDDY